MSTPTPRAGRSPKHCSCSLSGSSKRRNRSRMTRAGTQKKRRNTMIMSGIECAFGARVGTEPEVKIGKTSGKPWASFRACVGDKDTEQWLDVHVYGDKANSIPVTKGDRCYVEGKLRLEVRKGSDGVERPGLKVSAWRIERLGEIGRNKAAATQQT